MTWGFVYLAVLLVGLVLAAVTGLLRDLKSLARRHLTVPHTDQHRPLFALLGPRLACGLCAFGIVGLALAFHPWSDPSSTLVIATASAVVACLLSVLLLRRRCPPALDTGRAVVVREMPPGGYGQVRLESERGTIVLAAQSIDPETLAPGAIVEVVDCTRSVVTVRRALTE
jgi:hypothetical protein